MTESESKIREFYSKKTILITGITGLIGKLLLEKLMRSCEDIEEIYVLIRSKNEPFDKRLKQILDSSLFDWVRRNDRYFYRKIVAIQCDFCMPFLGISYEDQMILFEKIQIIFHTASKDRLNEALGITTIINIFGTSELLKLSMNMKKLICFLYVSNAYSFSPLEVIEERVYEGRVKASELITILNYDKANEKFDRLEERVLQWCPNVVSFTKGLTENLILDYSNSLPIAIIRPSLIISTYKEPYPNYLLRNSYGIDGIITALIDGMLRSLYCDEDAIANIIPADFLVNCMIAIPWDVSKNSHNYINPSCKIHDSIPVFNFESSTENPITWGKFLNESLKSGFRYPPKKALWCPSLTFKKSRFSYYISLVFRHFLPALFFDFFTILIGKQTKYWETVIKTYVLMRNMEHFMTKNTIFVSGNGRKLWEKMDESDRQIFNFDLKSLSWNEYFESYFLGIRIWILKDDVETLDDARRKYKRFKILDKILFFVYLIIFVLILVNVFNYVFSID